MILTDLYSVCNLLDRSDEKSPLYSEDRDIDVKGNLHLNPQINYFFISSID